MPCLHIPGYTGKAHQNGHQHLPPAVPRESGRRRAAGPRQHVRQREAAPHPADRPHLQLHLGLRRALHHVQQLEMGRSQVGHDPGRARPVMASPFWGAVENLNISGGEPTTRNDLPEMVELFQRHLPRLRKIGINTTGLTPHRAIPMLTRIVKFCAAHDLLLSVRVSLDGIGDIHDQVRRSRTASTRRARPSTRCRRWRKSTRTSRSAWPATIFATNLPDAENILAWARSSELDVVFNMLRFTDAMLHNKELEEKIGFHTREEQFMRKFFLDRVQEESVLSGQAFMYLHYADMIANGYQRTMPCPFQSQGLLLNPERRPALLRELREARQRARRQRRGALLQGREPRAPPAAQGQSLPDMPEPVPGQRRRHEAVRAVREVPEARLPGEARSRAPCRHDAGAGGQWTISRPARPTSDRLRRERVAAAPSRRCRRPDGARPLQRQPLGRHRRGGACRPALDWRGDRARVRRPHADGAALDRPAQRADAGIAARLPHRPAHLLRQLVRQQLRAERGGRHVSRLRAGPARCPAGRVDGVGADGPCPRRPVDGPGRSDGAAVRRRDRRRARPGDRIGAGVRRLRRCGRGGLQRTGGAAGAGRGGDRAVGPAARHHRRADRCGPALRPPSRRAGAGAADVDSRPGGAHPPGVVPRPLARHRAAAGHLLRAAAGHPARDAGAGYRQRLRNDAGGVRSAVRAGRRRRGADLRAVDPVPRPRHHRQPAWRRAVRDDVGPARRARIQRMTCEALGVAAAIAALAAAWILGPAPAGSSTRSPTSSRPHRGCRSAF